MCDTENASRNIWRFMQHCIADAMMTRARNIRFNGHQAQNKQERNWAKALTFAEAYGFRAEFAKSGRAPHGTGSERVHVGRRNVLLITGQRSPPRR